MGTHEALSARRMKTFDEAGPIYSRRYSKVFNKPTYYYSLLQCIHMVVTRGLQVITENAESFLENGFPNEDVQNGFYLYVHSLVSTINAHFRTTEEIAYPYLISNFPLLRSISTIIEQHKQMSPHVEIIQLSHERIKSKEPNEALEQLINASSKLNVLWPMHTNTEEGYWASDSATIRQLSQEEQSEFCKKNAEFNRNLHKTEPWVLIFILYNLPVKQREIMLQNMPRVITEKIIPTTLEGEGRLMKPFLLNI